MRAPSPYPLAGSVEAKAAWLHCRHLDTIPPATVRRSKPVALVEAGYPIGGPPAAVAAFLTRPVDLVEQAPAPVRGPVHRVVLDECISLSADTPMFD
jgi:hypothetical protein